MPMQSEGACLLGLLAKAKAMARRRSADFLIEWIPVGGAARGAGDDGAAGAGVFGGALLKVGDEGVEVAVEAGEESFAGVSDFRYNGVFVVWIHGGTWGGAGE